MGHGRICRLYFHDSLFARALAGQHNYTNRLRAALASCGVELRLVRNSQIARIASLALPRLDLFHMDAPMRSTGLTTRKAYYFPFWRIEGSAKRWEFEVAKTAFEPNLIDPRAARQFCRRMCQQHYPHATAAPNRGHMIYVPLQGRITAQRSFQTMSPIDMLEQTLAYAAGRRVVATLHPNEVYSDTDREALEALQRANSSLDIRVGDMAGLLAECDFVVTQNSSAALAGYFFGKPAILFGRIDFHHIAVNVAQTGVGEAFRLVSEVDPDYRKYLFWFLKQTTINAGSEMAERQIVEILRRRGWDL